MVEREIIISAIAIISVVVSIILYVSVLSDYQVATIYLFDLGVTIVLINDYCDRLKESKNKKKFLLQHFYEIPALLPLIFFSFIEYEASVAALLRALRIMSIFRLLRLLRLFNLFKMAKILKASGFVYLVILLVVSIIFGAVGMLVVEEENPNSTIKNFGDALWFSTTTITISGFGDVVPTTTEGRIISTMLIIVGLTTILGFISSFGATVVQRRISKKAVAHDLKKSIKDRIDILEDIHESEIDSLTNEIRFLHKKIYDGRESCSKCGFLYPDNSSYCNNCGSSLK
ncbi:MAG TPA: potassium channel family protein [Candidatus Nitrosocosmicus sp.]|nr:potassium channel family protein [Candidatus Nitrosocosmicus sp.]